MLGMSLSVRHREAKGRGPATTAPGQARPRGVGKTGAHAARLAQRAMHAARHQPARRQPSTLGREAR